MRKPILAYMPTFAPDVSYEDACGRPLIRLTNEQVANRITTLGARSRARPYLYMDCIDSIINTRDDVDLVVADARSSDWVRERLAIHHQQAGGYDLAFYPEKLSQWAVFNDILARHATADTRYFVYTSSDIIWAMDWVEECIKEFEKDPGLMILFPTVNSGDIALPIQLARGPQHIGLIDPADHIQCAGMAAARAPCLNAYAIIFRMDFLKTYGGYPDIFLNCFSESFLYYLAEAMGGKLRLCPRSWCYHHNGADMHGSGTAAGAYNYDLEKSTFTWIMDRVQKARAEGEMTPEFLKGILWKKKD